VTCLEKASQNNGSDPKTVLIPKGYAFSSMAMNAKNLTGVTLQIDGIWETSPYNEQWPRYEGSTDVLDFLTFTDCTDLTIKGEGTVDGLGYDWWVREWVRKNPGGRPQNLKFIRVQTAEIAGVTWLNPPFWNMELRDIDSVYVHDFEYRVDILRQFGHVSEAHQVQTFEDRITDFCFDFGMRVFGPYEWLVRMLFSGKTDWLSSPTFPLNTDGIDPSGSNVTIRNIKMTNWDDAVAVKPSNKGYKIAKDGCSQDITVENMTVQFGIGATIGSVPPSPQHACVRRVSFKNLQFNYPVKAIYVKSNPGVGTGEIRDIWYENIKMHFPLWYGIYIGPQQQEQPDGSGPGCMTYPLKPCETQPFIDFRNITLKNVHSEGGFFPPGIIRCNASNPCQDINLIDVNVTGWWKDMGWTYISEYAYGSAQNSYPDPYLGKQTERVFDLLTVDNALTFLGESVHLYDVDEVDILGW